MIERKAVMWAIAGGITGVLMLVCLLLDFAVNPHRSVPTAPVEIYALHSDQCEQLSASHLFYEQENTWSNFAYLLAGLLILLRGRTLPGLLFGANLCVLAFFSGLYHGSLAHMPQVMDVAWVYCALFSAMLYATFVLSGLFGDPWPWWTWLPLALVLDISGFMLKASVGGDSTPLFILMVMMLLTLLGLVVARSVQDDRLDKQVPRLRIAALNLDLPAPGVLVLELFALAALAVMGFIVRLNDGYDAVDDPAGHLIGITPKAMCSQGSWIQAHASWHVLGAFALLLLYDVLAQMHRGHPREDRPVIFG